MEKAMNQSMSVSQTTGTDLDNGCNVILLLDIEGNVVTQEDFENMLFNFFLGKLYGQIVSEKKNKAMHFKKLWDVKDGIHRLYIIDVILQPEQLTID